MPTSTVLAFDPDSSLSLAKLEVRFNLHAFQTSDEAISGLTHLHPDVVIARMEDGGIDLCRHVVQRDPVMPVILLSESPTTSDVLEGLRAGARDVVILEGQWVPVLEQRVEEAVKWRRLVEQDAEAQVQSFMVQTELYQQKAKASSQRVDDLNLQLRAEKGLVTQTQRQLELQRELAMAAVRAKGAFLANMTHELHTPLNAIIGYAEMLREDLPAERTDDADGIIMSGRRLLRMLQDVLNLARLESGEVHPIFEPVDVQGLIERSLSRVREAAERANVRLAAEVDPSVPSVVSDPRRLGEALDHLLDNAVKFGADAEVQLRVDRVDSGIQFSVVDHGVGFEPANLDRMLGAFNQIDDSAERGFEGVGMGLAIANQLARVLNGRLTATGAPGRGAVFKIWLPDVDDTAVEEGGRQEVTVLVIDDDPVLRRVLQHMLVADGHRVVTSANPEEALELARAYEPSLIALDVLLPGIDGLTLLGQFKSDPDLQHIPVVMLSASPDKGRSKKLGACGFLHKPITREALQEVVQQHALPPTLSVVVVGNGRVEADVERLLRSAGVSVRSVRVDYGLGDLSEIEAIVVPLTLPVELSSLVLPQLETVRDTAVFVAGDVGSDQEREFLEGVFGGILPLSAGLADELRGHLRPA